EGFNLIRIYFHYLIMLDFLLTKLIFCLVYKDIQNHHIFRSIPLVLMSGRKEEVTDKLTEPFEYFSFVEKPYDREQLVNAIRDAMMKAKKQPQSSPSRDAAKNPVDSGYGDITALTSEIELLRDKVAKLEKESESMKKQFNQLVSFIKQKISS
ncbi:MAG: response regulator, partial [Pleurocapsa sp.]